jgi:chromosome partitioning protein
MSKSICVFNNKGGVGKTTYLFHIAHILAKNGKKVLLVDIDTQSNLTNYCIDDTKIAKSWAKGGNSIYRVIEPIIRGTGDFEKLTPTNLHYSTDKGGNIWLVPGDLRLSDFEDLLGDTWNAARGGAEAALRTQSAIHRYIKYASKRCGADIVMIDMGPNLGSLNRSALAGSDYFVTPVAPDLFSIQGTENLGSKLVAWREQWNQCHENWKGTDLELPRGKPLFLGYVIQMHNQRGTGENGMTKGWNIYGAKMEEAVTNNIVKKIGNSQLALGISDFKLGQIPNLHSLVPYSQEARKPIFDCTGDDQLRGAHQTKARKSIVLFDEIIDAINNVA